MSENNKRKQKHLKRRNQNSWNQNNKEKKKRIIYRGKVKRNWRKIIKISCWNWDQRRRFEKEIKDAFEFGSFNFAKESLAILDNLQRARDAIKNDEKLKNNKDLDNFLENIKIIEKDLVSIFEKNRIKKIEVKEKQFDPNFHQAMSEIEDDNKDQGTILHEIQAGYMLGERLLRPALVSVSKKKASKNQENKDKKDEK